MKFKKRGLIKFLQALLILGMLDSLFLIYEHFSATASKYCSFGSTLNCGIVNKSVYANLDGLSYLLTIDWKLPIPIIDISGIHWILDFLTTNAFLGFMTLLLVFLMIVSVKNKKKKFLWIDKKKIGSWIKGLLSFGVIYGLYLFYIQHFIIKSYCLFCILLDLILITSAIIAWKIKWE